VNVRSWPTASLAGIGGVDAQEYFKLGAFTVQLLTIVQVELDCGHGANLGGPQDTAKVALQLSRVNVVAQSDSPLAFDSVEDFWGFTLAQVMSTADVSVNADSRDAGKLRSAHSWLEGT
jgi:hypothetical protein